MKTTFLFLISFLLINSVSAFEESGPGYEACMDSSRTSELVADPTDCHFFYSCVDDGQGGFLAYRMSCPELTGFDVSLQRCEWESTVESCNALELLPSELSD